MNVFFSFEFEMHLHLCVILSAFEVLCHFVTTLSTCPPSSFQDQSPCFERLDRSGPLVSDQSSSIRLLPLMFTLLFPHTVVYRSLSLSDDDIQIYSAPFFISLMIFPSDSNLYFAVHT